MASFIFYYISSTTSNPIKYNAFLITIDVASTNLNLAFLTSSPAVPIGNALYTLLNALATSIAYLVTTDGSFLSIPFNIASFNPSNVLISSNSSLEVNKP